MTFKVKTLLPLLIAVMALCSVRVLAQSHQPALAAVPNPFAITTEIIIYDLTNDTITHKIYTQTGALVADFFEDLVLSGTFSVIFNADTLPVGVYFAILEKNGENHPLRVIKTEEPTSVRETNGRTKIIVYPNPTTDRLTISTDLHISEAKLFDMQGKMVLQARVTNPGFIDMRSLDAGMYLLHLKTDDRTQIRRILKN